MIHKWIAPAKINLFLYVTGIRADKYHYIQTLFQFLDYGDMLQIIPNKTNKIQLFANQNYLIDKKNSILTAAKLLKKQALFQGKMSVPDHGAEIFLEKKIPIGSGLGGGSSNAATALIVLNKLWNINFTLNELALLGLQIGADVPGFIMGKTAIIEGIGDIIYPITREEKWYLIVYPSINISTSNMFSSLSLKNYTLKKSIPLLLKLPFSNHFEKIAKKNFFKIQELITMLSSYAPSRITGTGSCVFSEFKNKKSAEKVFSIIPKNMKKFIAKSVNVSPLHEIIYNTNYIS